MAKQAGVIGERAPEIAARSVQQAHARLELLPIQYIPKQVQARAVLNAACRVAAFQLHVDKSVWNFAFYPHMRCVTDHLDDLFMCHGIFPLAYLHGVTPRLDYFGL